MISLDAPPGRSPLAARGHLAGPRSLLHALVTIGVVALVATVFAVALMTSANPDIAWLLGFYALVGFADVIVGLVAWHRRPSNRTGAILVAAGFLTLAAAVGNSSETTLRFVGFSLAEAPIGALLHLTLAFPSGRLQDRAGRVLVAAGYATTIGLQIPQILFAGDPLGPFDGPEAVRRFDDAQTVLASLVVVAASALMIHRARGYPRTSVERRVLVGVYAYGVGTLLFLPLTANVLGRVMDVPEIPLFAVQLSVFFAMPFVFGAGILRGGFGRTGEIEELGAWLATSAADRTDLRQALAHTLGDPSLHLLFRRPGSPGYIDADGAPAALPGEDSLRAAVEIDGRDGPAGLIVYDRSLIADPELVRAAGSVVALAIDRERLTAELIDSREAVRRSRARIVEVSDAERRRFAQDLHDLLQSRLVLAALHAGTLALTAGSPEQTAAGARLRGELDEAITELRGLVQGVMPALLLERGLYVTAQDLADRMPLPTDLELDDDGRPLPIALATNAYFILAEALANVVKHSRASKVHVRLGRCGDDLVLEVRDDGVGGAAIGSGQGLRGMGDRVDAHDGRLTIESPPGGGTLLTVRLPCAS